jgi:hypothetical protein
MLEHRHNEADANEQQGQLDKCEYEKSQSFFSHGPDCLKIHLIRPVPFDNSGNLEI